MIKNLFCWLGIHNWREIYNDYPKVVQECTHCSRQRSTMHDMTYGCTYWANGDHWMN